MREESLASLLNSLRESMKRIHTEKYAKRKIEAALYYSKQLKKELGKGTKDNTGHAGGTTGGPKPRWCNI